MLEHDINFERTCNLEDGTTWKMENRRRAAINEYCASDSLAMHVWRNYFLNHNDDAQLIFKTLIKANIPITDGVIEAVISNV